MPGVEVSGAPSPSSSEERLLRQRKPLPRKRPSVSNQSSVETVRFIPTDGSGRVSNGITVSNSPTLPLTPPSPDEEKRSSDESQVRKVASSLSDRTTVRAVTPHAQSPPTPEITPSPPLTPSKRPPVSHVELSLSSQAPSFRTAFENISSDGEMGAAWLSTHSFLQQNPPPQRSLWRDESPSKSDGIRTKAASPVSSDTSDKDQAPKLGAFDWERAETLEAGSLGPLVENRRSPNHLGRNTGPDGNSLLPSPDMGNNDVRNAGTPSTPKRSLRDRVQDAQSRIDSPSIEMFRENIGWPAEETSPNVAERPSSRRLSALSTTSTVEAMIIDSSPRRTPRRLRHTEKRSSLRSSSSPKPTSQRTSPSSIAESRESQHRLVRKPACITEQDRRSLLSETSVSPSTTPTRCQQKVDVIPVVVIPQRHSSLQFSTPPSRAQSNSSSRRSGRRVATEPRSRTGSFDISHQRKQAKSDSVPMASQGTDKRGRGFAPPVIPPRSSSLSAPTSRDNSRATSLTSESLRQHTLAMDLEHQKRQVKQPVFEASGQAAPGSNGQRISVSPNPNPIVAGLDDMAHLRPPSLPFTQGSFQSSSPGPVEISEATAVSLFPHKNTSLLVVEQQMQPESRAVQTGYYRQLDNPQTPEMSHADPVNTDSPLTNPRAPPKPPVCKVTPPMDEVGHQHGTNGGAQENNVGFGRGRFGSVRRAWNGRPRSESLSSFTRSFSLRKAKNRKAGKDIDGRLHPLWRPRGFWDGFDSEEEEASPEVNDTGVCRNPENSLGISQERIIFEGPPSLHRRSPELRRLVDGMSRNAPRRYLMTGGRLKRGMLRARSSLNLRRLRTASQYGLRYRIVALRNLRKRMRCRLQQRGKAKREERRERMKRSIVLLNGGTADGGGVNVF